MNPARVLHECTNCMNDDDAGGCVQRFVVIVRLLVFKIKGKVGDLLCPTFFSLRQQCARVNSTLEYWQDIFVECMPEIRFKRDLSPETSVV